LCLNFYFPDFKTFVVSNLKPLRGNQLKLISAVKKLTSARSSAAAPDIIENTDTDVLSGLPASTLDDWEEFNKKLEVQEFMADVV